MKQLRAMFREVWWLWAGCFAAAASAVYFVSLFFLVLFPMLVVVFVYFSFVRFDRDGNPRNP